MSKIAIVTDTSCDLPGSFFEPEYISRASMKIHFGEEEFTDQVDISHDDFYNMMKKDKNVLPRTTQPQAQDFVKIYEELGEKGYDTIFSLHISSKMSGTVQAANVAKDMVEGLEVIPVDTKQVGPALGLFVYLFLQRLEKGDSVEELKGLVDKLLQEELIFEAFTVNTMEYLVKNGRVGKAKGFAAGLLNIKPILTLKNGEITPLDKVRGMKALVQKMASLGVEKLKDCEKPILFLTWGFNEMEEHVEEIKTTIEEELDREIKILRSRLAPTISCHSGPEVFSITTVEESFFA